MGGPTKHYHQFPPHTPPEVQRAWRRKKGQKYRNNTGIIQDQYRNNPDPPAGPRPCARQPSALLTAPVSAFRGLRRRWPCLRSPKIAEANPRAAVKGRPREGEIVEYRRGARAIRAPVEAFGQIGTKELPISADFSKLRRLMTPDQKPL